MPVSRYWAEWAWLGAGPGRPGSGGGGAASYQVLMEIDGERFAAVTADVPEPPGDAVRLAGLTLPGLANAHSHAFHRALRGRTQAGRGSFWSWREAMYALAQRLDPESYYALARAVFAEMALAGVTCVGEFHYLHHDSGGAPYADPNEMGHALAAAAAEAGLRLTLLDTLYLTSTVDGSPLDGVQRRFGDASVVAWAGRVEGLAAGAQLRVGAAAHSVRAVPADVLAELAKLLAGRPFHVHVSEQPAENEACRSFYGRSPTELLADCGLLGPTTTAVHATHLSDVDISLLGASGTGICLCPTTERDLGDGLGPGRALADAGCPLSLGTDSHAVIDLFEEARGVELHERLRSLQRGSFDAGELLAAASAAGHAALGWPDAGVIAPGARADLVSVRLDTVRTAGFDPAAVAAAVVFGAVAVDVHHVIVDGRPVVVDGQHVRVGDVPGELARTIGALWR